MRRRSLWTSSLMPSLGGLKIDSVAWLGQQTVLVKFSTVYGTAFVYQLYAGRVLLASTRDASVRKIRAALQPSDWPQHLQVIAVDSADRETDFGDQLPPRPYNQVRLRFTASSWPSDAEHIDVVRGDEPGGAVNSDTLVRRLLYDTDREYTVESDPLPGSGTWNFEVFGRDDTEPNGNAGPVLAASQKILAYPPDVAANSDDSRMTVSVASQQATVDFTYPSL